MEFVLYLLGGVLDILSVLLLILTLFGFGIRDNLKYMLFVSVLIVLPSYPLRILELDAVDIIAHTILLFLSLRMIFLIPLLYAFLVMIIGYIVFVLIQYFLLLGAGELDIDPLSIKARIYQAVTFLIIAGICYFLRRKKLHFSFVPDDLRTRVKLTTIHRQLVVLSVFAFFLLIYGLTHAYYIGDLLILLPIFYIVIGVFVLFLILFIKIEYKRGRERRKKYGGV